MADGKRPQPPPELDFDSDVEFHRLVDELDDMGNLDSSDALAIAVVAELNVALRDLEAADPGAEWIPEQLEKMRLGLEVYQRLKDLGLTPDTRRRTAKEDLRGKND